jgi:hypothetical protein
LGGRELALAHAAPALARVVEMTADPDPRVALAACREILDRAWGKAEAASRSLGNKDGGPILVVVPENPSA